MTAADLRNATWVDLQKHLTGMRLAVLMAWRTHGPGTTQQIALRAGISLLTFRPRTTELYQLGLITLEGREGNDGIYAAVPAAQARAAFERARSAGEQMQMNL